MKYLCLVLIFLLTLIFLSCGEKPSDINDPKTPEGAENNAPPLDVTDLKAVALDETVFLFWTEPEDIDEIEIEWSVCNSAKESQSLENSSGDDKTNDGGGVKTYTQNSSTKDSSGYWSNWKGNDANPLENGVTYRFTVRTIDDDDNHSNGVTVTATPNKNAISLSAIAGNGAVHLKCTLPEGLPSKNTVEYVEYFEAPDDEVEKNKKTIELGAGETSYCVEELEKGTRYGFRFCAKLYGRQYTSETVFCTPPRFLTNPDTERAVAIKCDGKVFLSWTYKKKNEFYTDLFFPKGVNVYIGDEFIEQITPILANEEVNPEQSGNEIDLYDKYYTYTVDVEKYSALALRAVNESDVEADALALPEATEVSLPIVDIKTKGLVPIGVGWESAKKEEKISSTLSLFNCDDKKLNEVELTVKGRGNSSWENAPKKSYTLKFSSKQAILGMKKHKSWALVANYFDKTLLRNITAYELGRDVYKNMAWTPSAKSVHLFMNGVYEGIYAFTETNKIDENRLNITNLEDYVDGDDFYEYGYLLEANDRADESFNFETNQSATNEKKLVFSLKEPDGADISEAVREKIKSEVLEREVKLFADDFSDENSENYWKNYFDEDSFIDWWIVSEFARNTDSNYFSSCYVYYEPKDKKLHAGPLWDFDLGFGNMRDLTDPNKTYTSDGVWLKRMFEDASFKKKACERWTETLPELQAYLNESYSKNLTALQRDVNLNFTRWPILGKLTWKCPNDYDSRKTYQEEVDYFKAWCESRKAWMTNWLSDTSIAE